MENQNKKNHNEDLGLDLTNLLLTLELVRSFRALWKSREVVLRFDDRKEMGQFVNLMDMVFAIEEEILEEEENEKK